MAQPDIVIVGAARTAVGSFSGSFANEAAHKLGAAAILQKPFENIELVQLVRKTLDAAKG